MLFAWVGFERGRSRVENLSNGSAPRRSAIGALGYQRCLALLLHLHGPGDAVPHVSRSSMVALHTLLSHVKCVASCNVIFSSLQSSFIMSIHRFFGLPLFLTL